MQVARHSQEQPSLPQPPPIFVITGPPGAGKTSVATALLQHFEFGLHIPVDDLREWVVSGIAHPVPLWTEETTRQFRLARQAAVQTARLYAEAGFAIAIDDIIYPAEAKALILNQLPDFTIHKILLLPKAEIALVRNARRNNKNFDTSILTEPIREIQRAMIEQNYGEAGWIIIDSSGLSIEETVKEVLKRVAQKTLN